MLIGGKLTIILSDHSHLYKELEHFFLASFHRVSETHVETWYSSKQISFLVLKNVLLDLYGNMETVF